MRVFKKKRNRSGKTVQDRYYTGRFKLAGEYKSRDIALKVTDKQVAEKKLREIVQELEKEKAGIIAPKSLRKAAVTPINDLLEEYIRDVKGRGRKPAYVSNLNTLISRIIDYGKWNRIKDVNALSFINWRDNSDLAPKTKNEHLAAISGFMDWLIRHGKAEFNPFKSVEKDKRGSQNPRRALTDEETSRLMTVSGKRKPFYLTALYTGLRRNELRQLLWGDVFIEAKNPHLKVRASTTKNGKDAILPLHPKLISELNAIRSENENPENPVFSGILFPHWRQRIRDFNSAKISRKDHLGRVADLHSLRHTFCTRLAKSGVPIRTAQALMRHSDPKLTSNVYTDETALNIYDSVTKLDWIEPSQEAEREPIEPSEECPLICPPETGKTGHSESFSDNSVAAKKTSPIRINIGLEVHGGVSS